jgi:hypothetical protein
MKKNVLLLMTFALMSAINVLAQGQQIPNGDFETWTYDGDNLPNNWNSFRTADGNMASLAGDSQVKKSTDTRPGSNGQYSCSIWARSVFGIVAQGNLTSGRVHAGSASATNKENYNYTDRDGSTTKGDVVNPCYMSFTGKPKAVKVWVKYVQGGSGYGVYNKAKFSAIIHDDADYISYGLPEYDTDANKALVVASAVKEIAYNGGEWEELVIPFEYTNNGAKPAYIQINASTNAYPGKGKANDYLYIDDIEMVYDEKVFTDDPLYVTVNEEKSGPYAATVYVTENADNTINFTLKNFVLDTGDAVLPVGNIVVSDIPATKADGKTTFAANQYIEIEEGDDPSYDFWMGPMLGEIPLEMSGQYNDEHLYVTIDIPLSDDMQVYVELGTDPTGVKNVKVTKKAQTTGKIYDLNGREVKEMQPGQIYIVDGVKVAK